MKMKAKTSTGKIRAKVVSKQMMSSPRMVVTSPSMKTNKSRDMEYMGRLKKR